MSRRYILLVVVFISCSIHAIAQTDYYYDINTGKKTPITLNDNKLLVSIPRDNEEISKRIRANVQALYWTYDNTFDFFFITRSDFEKLTSQDFWEKDAKSVIITPSYIIDDDRGELYQEVFALPYVLIRVKKEEDMDLLTPYLEKYRLIISWHSPWTPLAADLSLTLDSEKGPLEIANEIFESGKFEASKPGWALPYSPNDANTVHSITTPTTEESTEIYDLHGRKQATKPTEGIYILQGQKVLMKK